MCNFNIVGVTLDNARYATRGFYRLRFVGHDKALIERCADGLSQHAKAKHLRGQGVP